MQIDDILCMGYNLKVEWAGLRNEFELYLILIHQAEQHSAALCLIIHLRYPSLIRDIPLVSSALHTSGDPSQPIIISDTPSPAVSIITIPSDTEDEDDTKVPPTRCD